MLKSTVARFLPLCLAVLSASACQHPKDVFIDPTIVAPNQPDEVFPTGPQPEFGPTVTQATPPPPISGGTLTMLSDGNTAVAADPDRDQIYAVDIAAAKVLATIKLKAGDEPGRVIEDSHGRVQVLLRRGGALVTIDPVTWKPTARRPVCAAPRGVAAHPKLDQVYVACAGGELATLPGDDGAATRVLHLDRDLRDVVVRGDNLYVSRFRSAELIAVSSEGVVTARTTPAATTPSFGERAGQFFVPEGAWRMAVSPADGGVYMLHQRGFDGTVSVTRPGGYGSSGDPCNGSIVSTGVSRLVPGLAASPTANIPQAVLPVDFAFDKASDRVAIVSAANAKVPGAPTIVYANMNLSVVPNANDCTFDGSESFVDGEPIAVAYTGNDHLVVQSREPAQLVVVGLGLTIALSDNSKADTGHAVFHSNAGADLACASCHLEGGEDGRVWSFETSGPRRTQSIRGGIMSTAPFHWDGDQRDFGKLMGEVFQKRMSGPTLAGAQLTATQGWINAIPLLASSAPADPAAVERGRAIFEDGKNVGCASCHSGPLLSNNTSVDVGTGGKFQVPTLKGVAWRSPFLHDGRAPTLAARFSPSIGGGDQHGVTSGLSQTQIADLVAYLEAL